MADGEIVRSSFVLGVFVVFALLVTLHGASADFVGNTVHYYNFSSGLEDSADGIDLNNAGTSQTTGFIGNGRFGDGGDYMTAAIFPDEDSHTVSVWVNLNASETGGGYLVYSLGTSFGNRRVLVTANEEAQCQWGTGATNVVVTSTTILSSDTWYLITCSWDDPQDRLLLYVDDALEGNASATEAAGWTTDFDVMCESACSFGFHGRVDEIGVFNQSFTLEDQEFLYNEGSGNQYPYSGGGGGVNTVTVTLSNVVNGSAWPSSVTFSNVTGTLDFSYTNITSTGYCVTLTGNGTHTNCTAGNGASTWFNTSNTSVSVTGTESVSAGTYAALLSINASRLFLNTSIASFNITNWLLTNTTTSGTLQIKANDGTNNVKIDVEGNYSLNATCTGASLTTSACTMEGVFDDVFKINASDALNGVAITTFNVTVSNDTLGGQLYNSMTTNGSVFFPLIQGYWYNFFFDATGYAYANVTLEANASTNTYEFSLLPQNSIFLYFYDQTTLDPIFENVTVTFNNGSFSFQNTSNTSEMIANDLSVGLWTITASAPSYDGAQYFVTITERSAQDLDVYLLNSTLSGETTITIKDGDTADVIQNATVTMQIKVGANWVTFDQQTSDLFGVTFFDLEQGEQYQVIVEAEEYATKTGVFTRTTSAYIIVMSSANTQSFTTYGDDFTYVIAPTSVNASLTNFSITTSSPTGAIEWFAVVATINATTDSQNVTGSPSGGTALASLDLTGVAGQTVYVTYYVKSVSFDEPLVLERNWYIAGFVEGNYTLSGFMEYYEDDENGLSTVSRGILGTVGAVLVGALLGFIFGSAAAVVGASLSFMVAAFYGWIHWSIIIVVVGGLLGGLLLTGRGR